MQEKTEVALIARIFLCYYYFFFFTHKHPCFFPFQLLCCCAKQEIHTQEKKKFGIMSKSVSMQAASLSQNP